MNRYSTLAFKTLQSIQNGHYENQDIITITGFQNNAQLLEHVTGYAIRTNTPFDVEQARIELGL